MAGRALLASALAAALVGCGAQEVSAPPPLSAEVKQYRRDIAPRILSVAVTNPGDRAVVVRRLDLLAGGFAEDPPAEVEVEVPAGRRVDVRLPYGRARCDDGRPSGSDAALLDVQAADGQRHDVRLQLPPGNGLLDRLHARECADQALRAAVDVRLSAQWSRAGAELRGALVLERRSGSAPVVVVEPGGNVLFTVRPVAPVTALGTLAADAPVLELPLRITATRCDGHALAESKRSYVLTFYLALGGGEPQLISTTADEPLQRELDRLALDTCRPGS